MPVRNVTIYFTKLELEKLVKDALIANGYNPLGINFHIGTLYRRGDLMDSGTQVVTGLSFCNEELLHV